MTLDQLRIFIEVAACQHITKASKNLNMTQSAVSAAVSALESRHGILLFDRVGRSIVLNQTGRVFLNEARAVLAQARVAETALQDLAGLMRGELSIMASQTIGAHWLPERLVAYRARYPGVKLDVRIGNTLEVADAVESGLVEFGMVEGMVDRPAIAARIIAMDEMIIVTAPAHPWASLQAIRAEALSESLWVLREPGSGTRLAFDTWMKQSGLEIGQLDIAMVLPGNEAVLGAVEAGLGATLMSRSAASTRLRGGLLQEIAFAPVPRPFYQLRHKERYRSKAADAFEAMIAQT
jgi:DNA-binding transcriptional LysR family regulator